MLAPKCPECCSRNPVLGCVRCERYAKHQRIATSKSTRELYSPKLLNCSYLTEFGISTSDAIAILRCFFGAAVAIYLLPFPKIIATSIATHLQNFNSNSISQWPIIAFVLFHGASAWAKGGSWCNTLPFSSYSGKENWQRTRRLALCLRCQ